jgi:hypothetical protein
MVLPPSWTTELATKGSGPYEQGTEMIQRQNQLVLGNGTGIPPGVQGLTRTRTRLKPNP